MGGGPSRPKPYFGGTPGPEISEGPAPPPSAADEPRQIDSCDENEDPSCFRLCDPMYCDTSEDVMTDPKWKNWDLPSPIVDTGCRICRTHPDYVVKVSQKSEEVAEHVWEVLDGVSELQPAEAFEKGFTLVKTVINFFGLSDQPEQSLTLDLNGLFEKFRQEEAAREAKHFLESLQGKYDAIVERTEELKHYKARSTKDTDLSEIVGSLDNIGGQFRRETILLDFAYYTLPQLYTNAVLQLNMMHLRALVVDPTDAEAKMKDAQSKFDEYAELIKKYHDSALRYRSDSIHTTCSPKREDYGGISSNMEFAYEAADDIVPDREISESAKLQVEWGLGVGSFEDPQTHCHWHGERTDGQSLRHMVNNYKIDVMSGTSSFFSNYVDSFSKLGRAYSRSSFSMASMFEGVDANGHQLWTIRQGDGEYYHIVTSGYGAAKFLSSRPDGKVVHLWEKDDGSGRQRWVITGSDDGGYNVMVSGGVAADRRFLSWSENGLQLSSSLDGSGRQSWILPGFEPQPCSASFVGWDVAGEEVALVTVSGPGPDELDAACCLECRRDSRCQYWLREEKNSGAALCRLRQNPKNDGFSKVPELRGAFFAGVRARNISWNHGGCKKEQRNFGNISAQQCAAQTFLEPSCGGTFMYSQNYPVWGCRCCALGDEGANDENKNWQLYSIYEAAHEVSNNGGCQEPVPKTFGAYYP